MLGSFSFIWRNFFSFERGTFLVPGRQKTSADYLEIKIEQIEPVQSFCPV